MLDDEAVHPLLNGRHNIVVMSDEAHRSQYGLKAVLTKEVAYKFGYAKHMRDALKNASFIGFTGTPDVRRMPYRNLAVELLEKLLNDSIKAKTRNNVVQEKKYAERLLETLRKYNNRAIETAQVIEELI